MKTALFIIALILGAGGAIYAFLRNTFKPDVPTGTVNTPHEDDAEIKEELEKIDKETADEITDTNNHDASTHAGGIDLLHDYTETFGGKAKSVHVDKQPEDNSSSS